jgi:light-regulated signal transduction histidine kinase (bacteriophytochrome)
VEDYGDKLDEKGREYLARVCGEAQRMGNLIDDMLQLSRLTRAKMRREPVDLSAMVRSILADLHQHDHQRQVETVVSSGLNAVGDAVLLQSVLQNLLDNAWKFTSKNANARIEFGVMEKWNDDGLSHSTRDPNPSTPSTPVFFVRDNGAGFNMAHTTKLFAPFHRLHRQNEFPGTGVGLASVQRIIHRHGGRIWAAAAPDKGATFYFTLPTQPSNYD